MKKIKLLESVYCQGYFDYRRGQEVEVSEYWAKRLISKGAAEEVAGSLPPRPPAPVRKKKTKK